VNQVLCPDDRLGQRPAPLCRRSGPTAVVVDLTPKKLEDLNPLKPNDLMELKVRMKNLLDTTARTFMVARAMECSLICLQKKAQQIFA
jgi:hypothetical protein